MLSSYAILVILSVAKDLQKHWEILRYAQDDRVAWDDRVVETKLKF
jgi:acetone carboxylase gamma subunit